MTLMSDPTVTPSNRHTTVKGDFLIISNTLNSQGGSWLRPALIEI